MLHTLKQLLPSVASLVLAAGAHAQAFNVSFGTGSTAPAPSSSFGAAAGQPGVWNAVRSPTLSTPLATTGGGSAGVTLTTSYCGPQYFNANAAGSGDFARLMNNGLSLPYEVQFTATWSVVFRGLTNGSYTVFIYACAPWDPNSSVRLFVGSHEVVLGGQAPVDTFVAGVTHTAQQVTVTNGILGVSLVANGFHDAFLNGIQLVPSTEVVNACSVTQAPAPQAVLKEQTATFAAAITGDIRGYRWTRNGVDVFDGRGVSAAQTSTLVITEARPSDNGQYALRYLCGGEWRTTPAAALTVTDCPGDFNRSGIVSTQDIFDFLGAYFTGCP